ncbi:MAG: tRNA threonylcarbamoyladenosine dehydratase [Bacteroidales bacterium]|nr:tRNA threonylcarbamoyladenosine dehydratase [Bacteroidales bacterium]
MWRERTKLLLGNESLEKLQNSRVLICGLGGVGGAAAEQLVRAGVGNLCIIDADTISESNINRQIIATHNNIGTLKTEALKERLLLINPNLNLSLKSEFLKDIMLEKILLEAWDYVIDAIDTLSPKLELIRVCYKNNIPFVSSMGAGGKTDPTCINIADISKSYNCNLARIIRKRLHQIGIYKGFTVVFSTQKTDKNAIIEEESQNKKSNVGTISYMPTIFGCMCAYAAIQGIAEI